VIGCEYASICHGTGRGVPLVDGEETSCCRFWLRRDYFSERLRDRFASLGMHLGSNERPVGRRKIRHGSRLHEELESAETESALLERGGGRRWMDWALEKAGPRGHDKAIHFGGRELQDCGVGGWTYLCAGK